MKKQLILLIGSMIISVGFLSGCNEKVSSSNIELVSYNIATKWEIEWYYNDNWERIPGEVHYCDGFCHNITEDVPHFDKEKLCFKVTGTIKNNANKKLDYISIDVNFYDLDWNLLCTKSTSIRDLPNSYSKNFTIEVFKYDSLVIEPCEYYDDIENIDFKFSIS